MVDKRRTTLTEKVKSFTDVFKSSTSSSKVNISKSDNVIDPTSPTVASEVEGKIITSVSNDFPNLETSSYVNSAGFEEFRTLSNDRLSKYQAYESMMNDTIISSALDMYADDASQFDTNSKLLWVSSDNEDVEVYLNELIDQLGIEHDLRTICYSLASYGDAYLKLFKYVITDDSNDNALLESMGYDKDTPDTEIKLTNEGYMVSDPRVRYENHYELMDNPEDIYEIVSDGLPAQFAVVERSDNRNVINASMITKNNQIVMYPPDSFIHFCLDNPLIRDRQLLEFESVDNDSNEKSFHSYKVKTGRSLIDAVYPAFKELELLENSIIMDRINKSSTTRLFQVEVGSAAKPEVTSILRRVQEVFESKLSLDSKDGMASYNNPEAFSNIVVSPTRNGKGQISHDLIGGDITTDQLIDIDYFNDKKFGALKIPKAFLGFDEYLGANSGGTLTKMDSRYGRTVKRIQTSVKSGLTQLFNLYLVRNTILSAEVNNFTVHMVSPTTTEDMDRDETISTRMNTVRSILEITDMVQSPHDKNELMRYLITTYLNDPELSRILFTSDDKRKSKGKSTNSDSDSVNFDDLVNQFNDNMGNK